MEESKGLTLVTHKDLLQAVDKWKMAKEYFHNINESKVKYAEKEFNKLPYLKRFKLKYTSCDWLFFIPVCTIYAHGSDFMVDYCESVGGDKYKSLLKYDYYFYSNILQGMIAKECQRHSLYGGLHYLTDRQVEFVRVFKDLEI